MKAVYKIAGKLVEIESFYDETHVLCRDYLYHGEKPAEITLKVNESDIAYERKKAALNEQSADRSVSDYSDSYLETLAVYRRLAEKFVEYNILLFHGSVVAVDGVGYLFTAKCGTGKSTHTRLWREYFGERAVMINDDKPLIEITDNKIIVYGTPWSGKHFLNTNTAVPLKAICVLSRGITNHIEKAEPMKVYSMLLQQVYRPADRELMKRTMELIDAIMKKTEFYLLGCNMKPEAAAAAYQGMNGGNENET